MRALSRLRRACIRLALAAVTWAAAAAITGGISFSIEGIRVSSRNPRNPALLALALLAVAWLLGGVRRRPAAVVDEWRHAISPLLQWIRTAWRGCLIADAAITLRTPPRAVHVLVAIIATGIVVLGLTKGALVASGSDAAGYLSQAQLWAKGRLKGVPPLMRELTPDIPRQAFAPLAWVPARDEPAIVPVTGPGLPMAMALAELIAGPQAVFYVVPLLAGATIIATYFLGAVLSTPGVGLLASSLLACSPSFLFQLTSAPMSDIPAALWWALCLASAISALRHDSWHWALAAGVFAGAGVLTRPNLVPIALVPGAIVLVGHGHWRKAITRLSWFAAGVVPAAITIAVLYDSWYGSPFTSGYGTLDALYQWRNLLPNVTRYPRWVVESQSPIVALAIVAPLVVSWQERNRDQKHMQRRAAAGLTAFVLACFGCYAFYIVFDVWWFVRFLLPAYPALLTLTAAATVGLAARIAPRLRLTVTMIVLIAVAWHALRFAQAASTFNVAGEWKYLAGGTYLLQHVPERAVILADQHSGSAWYYTQRTTVRYVFLPADRLDRLVTAVERLGYEVYLLVEDYEQPEFLKQFATARAASAVRRTPLVRLTGGTPPIYDLRVYRLTLQ